MKRVISAALALIMIVLTIGAKETQEVGEEKESNWTTREFVSEDDFGDESRQALLTYMVVGTIPEDDSNALITVLISSGKVLGLTGDLADKTLFTLNAVGTSMSNLGEFIFDESEIKMKIKINEEQYEINLINVSSGIYATFADGNELYEKMIESFEKEEAVKCVLVSDSTKLQFQLDGFGYSKAVDLMNEFNELGAAEREETFNVDEGIITRK